MMRHLLSVSAVVSFVPIGLAQLTSRVAPVPPARIAAARSVINRMFEAREQIPGGRLELSYSWDFVQTGRMVCSVQRALFRDSKYCMEVFEHNGMEHLFLTRGIDVPNRLAVVIWDGQHVLASKADLHRTTRWMHVATVPGIPTYNPRWIGLPLVRAPYIDERAPFCGAEVLEFSWSGDVCRMRLWLDRREGDSVLATNSTIQMTIDASRDYALTSYEVVEDNGGFHWNLKGETTYAQYGDVWFPSWHRQEQWRDGVLDWAREYAIVDASFGADAATPEQFTWKGTGIRARDTIFSSVPGIGTSMWDGEKVVPWRAGPIKAQATAGDD